MENLMIDLEALGKDMIVQIGAAYFDWEGNVGSKLLINVDLHSLIEIGASFGYGEIKFWLEHANQITWLDNTVHIKNAWKELKRFCKDAKEVWSHYYDVMLLERTAELLESKMPFHFRRWRDIRTLTSLGMQLGLYKYKRKKGEDPKNHNALDDAIYQIEYVTKVYRKMEGRIKMNLTEEDIKREECSCQFY